MLYFDTWERFSTFKGRATRSEYWTFIILTPIITFILTLISFHLGWTWTDIHKTEEYGTLPTIFGLLSIVPHISVSVRRLHDINLSGWWGWLFIPLGLPMFIAGFIGSKEKEKNS